MRICFVGPSSSAHIIKWCDWFSKRGHEVHVISFSGDKIPSAEVHHIDIGVDPNGGELAKMKYMLTGRKIKRIIDGIRPDIVNAHYATSYGVAMALSGVKNYVLSVWGSDIYDFPAKSPAHKALLKFSLNSARYLFSTSKAMADEAGKYVKRRFYITPFGVDMQLFTPDKRTRGDDGLFIAGTVKALTDKYGISYILEAAAEVRNTKGIDLRLRIAGKGDHEEEYRQLADKLGIADTTEWLGFIPQEQAAVEWANMDVAVVPSAQESFGVSAVEAEASGTAVIVSDIPGLMEATKPGETSVVVERMNPHQIAEVLADLYNDPDKRRSLGENGRSFALRNYELDRCFRKIEHYYDQIKEKIK